MTSPADFKDLVTRTRTGEGWFGWATVMSVCECGAATMNYVEVFRPNVIHCPHCGDTSIEVVRPFLTTDLGEAYSEGEILRPFGVFE